MNHDLLRHQFFKIAFLHCSEHRLFQNSFARPYAVSLVLILLPSPTKPDSDDALMRIIVSQICSRYLLDLMNVTKSCPEGFSLTSLLVT